MKKILIDQKIRNSLLEEFGVSGKTLYTVLYFRDTPQNKWNRKALERHARIRKRALELGGIQVEFSYLLKN